MIGTGAALIGSALIGGGASIFGSMGASRAQRDAANQAAAVQREALQFQRQNYGEAQGNLNPFIRSGQGANDLLSSFYGLGGNEALGQNALERFYQSPDFQTSLRGGRQALDNSASARGGVLGGNQIRAQTEFGSGLATQNLGNYLSRLGGMSQQGQNAASSLGGIGTGTGAAMSNTANNIGNSLMSAGQAQASGYVGMANGINSSLNNLLMYNQMGRSSFGGGGGNTGLSLTNTGGLY